MGPNSEVQISMGWKFPSHPCPPASQFTSPEANKDTRIKGILPEIFYIMPLGQPSLGIIPAATIIETRIMTAVKWRSGNESWRLSPRAGSAIWSGSFMISVHFLSLLEIYKKDFFKVKVLVFIYLSTQDNSACADTMGMQWALMISSWWGRGNESSNHTVEVFLESEPLVLSYTGDGGPRPPFKSNLEAWSANAAQRVWSWQVQVWLRNSKRQSGGSETGMAAGPGPCRALESCQWPRSSLQAQREATEESRADPCVSLSPALPAPGPIPWSGSFPAPMSTGSCYEEIQREWFWVMLLYLSWQLCKATQAFSSKLPG